jgi:chromosome segregation ATPase
MDLSDEQQDALDALTSTFDSDEQVAEALKAEAQSVYQVAYDNGHQDGLGEAEGKAGRFKEQRDELEEKLNAREEELQQLREETPDAEELRRQWEESELQPLKEKLEQKDSRLRSLNEERALSKIQQRIQGEVASEWVAEKLVDDARDRVDTSGEEPTYLRPDGQTPYATASDQDPADAFAEDLLSEVPSDLRDTARNDGSDFGNANPGDGVKRKPKSEISRSERAEMYEKWRNQGKDPNEEWSKLPEE